jgi:hypothetical protein
VFCNGAPSIGVHGKRLQGSGQGEPRERETSEWLGVDCRDTMLRAAVIGDVLPVGAALKQLVTVDDRACGVGPLSRQMTRYISAEGLPDRKCRLYCEGGTRYLIDVTVERN